MMVWTLLAISVLPVRIPQEPSALLLWDVTFEAINILGPYPVLLISRAKSVRSVRDFSRPSTYFRTAFRYEAQFCYC